MRLRESKCYLTGLNRSYQGESLVNNRYAIDLGTDRVQSMGYNSGRVHNRNWLKQSTSNDDGNNLREESNEDTRRKTRRRDPDALRNTEDIDDSDMKKIVKTMCEDQCITSDPYVHYIL
ncbi:hypothetical protein AVEN_206909-1 [Araneus ventricosus]|uniref:Uncharacterized protein n=1 Tax=Araneus ventricosus TaxID=182803 RepID=A0A4Y2MDK9_ARAVE|nr:hypothetical protein AVEN_206909-1 [Araneus ventricosus]